MLRRRLTLVESVRVVKNFYEILIERAGVAVFDYFGLTQVQATEICTRYNLAELQDTRAPYIISLEFLKTFFTTINSYLSSANLFGPIDEFLAENNGQRETARDLLITQIDSEENSISVVKDAARQMLSAVKFLKNKVGLGEALIESYNKFLGLNTATDNLQNRIIQGDLTKDEGLERISNVLSGLDETVNKFLNFFKAEPLPDEYNGICILFGQNPMSSEVDDASIAALIEEATDSSPRIGLRANHELRDRKDIPLLNNHYTTLMELYGRVKNTADKDGDERRVFTRTQRAIESDGQALADDILSPDNTDLQSISIVNDYIRQLEDLSRRASALSATTDDPICFKDILVLTKTGGAESLQFKKFLKESKHALLIQKDEIQVKQKEMRMLTYLGKT